MILPPRELVLSEFAIDATWSDEMISAAVEGRIRMINSSSQMQRAIVLTPTQKSHEGVTPHSNYSQEARRCSIHSVTKDSALETKDSHLIHRI